MTNKQEKAKRLFSSFLGKFYKEMDFDDAKMCWKGNTKLLFLGLNALWMAHCDSNDLDGMIHDFTFEIQSTEVKSILVSRHRVHGDTDQVMRLVHWNYYRDEKMTSAQIADAIYDAGDCEII